MKKDFIIILVLIGFVILFWLPAFLKWVPLLGDDYIYHHFPIKVLYARSLQQGTLPWWDPHTFCGAWPITHRPDGGPYYLPDYPFLLLVNLSSLDLAADLLVKVPMLLHYIIMIVSAYLLGRFGLCLNRVGSVILSVAYTMSPAVNYLAFAASIVTLNCWLPSLWLLLLLFIRKGGLRYVALGALVLALQISGTGAGHLMRVWTFTAFLFGGLAIKYLFERHWLQLRRLFAGGIVLVILGLILSAPVWLGLLEGFQSLDSSGVITFQSVAGGPNSMQPGYLSTLLIPNLFGSVIGIHGWGVARGVLFDQANLLGGMLLIFLVAAGLIASIRSSGASERFWIILSGIGVVFGLFVVLGRHTPVYRFLFQFFPVFRIPYANRWRDFECYSMVLMAGASASILTRFVPRPRIINRVMIISLLALVLIIVGSAFIMPFRWRGKLYDPGIMQAVATGKLSGVLQGVVPYLIYCLLILAAMWMNARHRVRLLVMGVLIELTLWGWLTFYLHQDYYGDWAILKHYNYFNEAPLAKVVHIIGSDKYNDSRLYRTVFYRSRLANSSWLTGGLSLFGYDCKPLLARFDSVLRHIGPRGIIYEMVIEKWDTRFMANMSAARAIVEAEQVAPTVDEPSIEDIIIPVVETDGPEARMAEQPVVVDVPGALPRVFTQDTVVCCSQEEAMEELIYGDLRRGVFLEEGEQLAVNGKQSLKESKQLAVNSQQSGEDGKRLAVSSEQSGEDGKRLAVSSEQLGEDGKRLAVSSEQLGEDGKRLAVSSEQSGEDGKRLAVSSEQLPLTACRLPLTAHRLPLTDFSSFKRDPGSIEHFNELQSANPINELDLGNPNRVQLTIDMATPSMLVMTDVWHPDWEVTVDGEATRLLRVNYLQRGLWLGKGRHEVIMTFVPQSWRLGRWGTIVGVVLVLSMIIFGRWKNRKTEANPKS